MKTMKRMMILALLAMVSVGLKAQDAQVKVLFSDFTGGTVETEAIEGQKVTITVTPAEGYFIAKSDMEVIAVKDPASATRGDEGISVGSALELIGDDPEDLTQARAYSFVVPEGLGAWVCKADFHESGKPVTSGDLNEDVTWEVTGEESAMVLTLSGKGTAGIVYTKGGSNSGLPWSQFAEDITELVIEGDIEAIGDGLLKDLTALTAITLKSAKFVALGGNELPKEVAVDVPGQFYNEYKANAGWSAATLDSKDGILMKGVAFGKGNDYDVFVSSEAVLVPSVLLAFTVSDIDGSNVKISEITDGIIPANVPVLLLSKETDDDDFRTAVSSEAGSAKDEGLLKAAGPGGQKVTLGEVYLLYNDVFYLSQAGTIPEGGVYLTMPKEEETQPSKTRAALTIGTDGTTAIIDVSRLIDSPSATTKSGWYDLNGRRLNAAPTRSGLYIYNGKIVAKPCPSTPF